MTSGNPFYVVETLRTGRDQVPRSALDAVLARVAGLESGARDAINAAALMGAVIEPWLLERAAPATPQLVDELVARGLLIADGATLRFRHEIARRAVASAVPGHRQPSIHARVLAELLAAGCSDHARLAFHAEAAGDEAAALEHATLAGRPPSLGRTRRRPRSSSERCGSPPGSRPRREPAATAPWPTSCR